MNPASAPVSEVFTSGALHRRMARCVCSALLVGLSALAPTTAMAAELVMLDGRRVAGEIIEQNSETITLAIPSGVRLLPASYPASTIDRIEPAPEHPVAQEIRTIRRLDAAEVGDADLSELESLLASAKSQRMTGVVRRTQELLVRLDASREADAAAAGLTRVRGVWMRANEKNIAQGLVPMGGQWVTFAQRQQARAAAAAAAATAQLDPVIGVANSGQSLSVRPVASADRRYVTMGIDVSSSQLVDMRQVIIQAPTVPLHGVPRFPGILGGAGGSDSWLQHTFRR